jgi:glycerophosphoryl diester phosphodiesterase
MSEVMRIGHKGADLIEPGNTVASFEAALRHGVDMIEFDVLPEHPDGSGALWLAHDYRDAHRRTPLTLEEGLELFASEAYARVRLDVDLKWVGYEDRVVDALRTYGLLDRVLISTMETQSLRRLREIAPQVRLGRSVPRLRRNPMDHVLTRPLGIGIYAWSQTALPRRLAAELQAGRIDAVMAHYAFVTRRFVRAILDAGGELYVWTVDDAGRIAALRELAVTGIITNDPRLLGPPGGPHTSPR